MLFAQGMTWIPIPRLFRWQFGWRKRVPGCRGSMNFNIFSTEEIDDMISDIGKLRTLGALRRDFFFFLLESLY